MNRGQDFFRGFVVRNRKPKPAVMSRTRGRCRRIDCNPSRRPSENHRAGREGQAWQWQPRETGGTSETGLGLIWFILSVLFI